jgi:gluconolactonase
MIFFKKQTVFICKVVFLIILSFQTPVSAEGSSGILAPNAALVEIQSNFSFTEGPAADSEGNVYFSDIRTQRIYKWDYRDNAVAVYREKTNQANGLMFDPKGRLIICEMGAGRVTMDDGNGQTQVLAEMYQEQKLHSPNDLWVDGKGGIYFSDYAGGARNQSDSLHVYYVTPDHNTLIRVTDAFIRPNGVIGSQNGKLLYIADSGAQKIWLYDIQSDGQLTGKRLFIDQYADGMTIDETGNLYVAGSKAILIFNQNGKRVESINVPNQTTNVTFCGKDSRTLFITAHSAVYTIRMNVKGGAPKPSDK